MSRGLYQLEIPPGEGITNSPKDPQSVLHPGEVLLFTQSSTGLYRGQQRWEAFEYGTVYLTSKRLLFLSAPPKDPRVYRLALDLAHVTSMTTYGGFTRQSSPKITLELGPLAQKKDQEGRGRSSPGPHPSVEHVRSPDLTPRSLSLPPAPSTSEASRDGRGEWTCLVCGCGNETSQGRCSLCGVPPPMASRTSQSSTPPTSHTAPSFSSTSPSPSSSSSSSSSSSTSLPLPVPTLTSGVTEEGYLTCSACTFHNHLELLNCEMCGTALLSARPALHFPKEECEGVKKIKVSFRDGGFSEAVAALNRILHEKAWEKPQTLDRMSKSRASPSHEPSKSVGGITNILEGVQLAGDTVESNLSHAFTDLEALMSRAEEMRQLAETMATKAGIPSGFSFSAHLQHLGVDNTLPSYLGARGKEMGREEVEDILTPHVDAAGGMIPLVDAYCILNRLRGIDPLTTGEFRKVCSHLERPIPPGSNESGGKLRLRRFPHGILVLQSTMMTDEMVLEELLRLIRKTGSVSVIEASRDLQRSAILVEEQLLMAEATGTLCRDMSVEGIRFYENVYMCS